MKTKAVNIFAAILLQAFIALPPSTTVAADNYKGWEIDSEYNALYNYKERDSLKGKLVKFKKIVPIKGMAPGTGFILLEGDEEIVVHLCPWEYADPKKTGLRKGVKTKVKGAWAVIDDEDVFIAAKAKQGENFEFKVRLTKDGKPFWSMTPEELAQETGH